MRKQLLWKLRARIAIGDLLTIRIAVARPQLDAVRIAVLIVGVLIAVRIAAKLEASAAARSIRSIVVAGLVLVTGIGIRLLG